MILTIESKREELTMPGIRVRDMFTTFKSLSGKEKLRYAWDYFRYPALIAGCLLAFLISQLVHYITYRDPYLQVLAINPQRLVMEEENWFDDFFFQQGYERFQGDVQTIGISSGGDEDLYRYENYLSMATRLNAGNDLLLGIGLDYEQVAKEGALADLSELLPEELLRMYEDQLLYSTNNGTTQSYPCAIFLEESEWLQQTGCYPDGCYFAICHQSANPQTAVEFAKYLLAGE